jgi:hypothetical protein
MRPYVGGELSPEDLSFRIGSFRVSWKACGGQGVQSIRLHNVEKLHALPSIEKGSPNETTPRHFIFSIQSVGMQKPALLVAEALRILQQKCSNLIDLTKEQKNEF